MQKHERIRHHKASNHCRCSTWFSRLLLAVACRRSREGTRGQARARRHTCTRVYARAHTQAHVHEDAWPTPINPGSRSRRPHGSSGGRTDLPTSEAGTAFRSSPRPVEARFESHARQLCASPIPQPCVLVLPYQALFLLYGWVSCATKRFQKNHKRLPYCRYHLCTGQKY